MRVVPLEIASLLYHEVVDNPRDSGFQRNSAIPYKHSVAEFQENLATIAASPIRPQLLSEINFARTGKHLLLTFDDGGISALHISDEICKMGWRAHFFIATAFLGQRNFLDLNEIKYLHNCGHIIGSHSHTHPDIFRNHTLDRMIEEWRISCDILNQSLGTPCFAASVPGGDISQNVLRSADLAGLRYLFTSEPELRPRHAGSCLILGRMCLKSGTPIRRLERYIGFQNWNRELKIRQTKTVLKTTFDPLYRFYVRRTTREWSE